MVHRDRLRCPWKLFSLDFRQLHFVLPFFSSPSSFFLFSLLLPQLFPSSLSLNMKYGMFPCSPSHGSSEPFMRSGVCGVLAVVQMGWMDERRFTAVGPPGGRWIFNLRLHPHVTLPTQLLGHARARGSVRACAAPWGSCSQDVAYTGQLRELWFS